MGKKQKFPKGARVRIANKLGPTMCHFSGAGCDATVLYTYAERYWGNDITSYALDVDGSGHSAWYKEHQLTLLTKKGGTAI